MWHVLLLLPRGCQTQQCGGKAVYGAHASTALEGCLKPLQRCSTKEVRLHTSNISQGDNSVSEIVSCSVAPASIHDDSTVAACKSVSLL